MKSEFTKALVATKEAWQVVWSQSVIVQYCNKYVVMLNIYYSTDDGYMIVSYPRYILCDVYLGKESALGVLNFPITDRTLEYRRLTG